MHSLLTNPIAIAFFFVLLILLYKIIDLYVKSNNLLYNYSNKFKDFFLFQEEINDVFSYIQENWPTEINTELRHFLGENKRDRSIREIILVDLTKYNSSIQTFGNLLPAVGLAATFMGLFLTLSQIDLNFMDILVTSELYTNVISALNHLAPVFLIGFAGIILYGVAFWLLNNLETKQNLTTNELTDIYYNFESKYFTTKITNVEEVYERLIKPLNRVLNKINLINNNFEQISRKTEVFVEEIGQKTAQFVNNLGANTDEYINAVNSGVQGILIKFEETSINVLNKLNQEFLHNIQFLNDIFQKLGNVLEVNIKRQNNLAEISIRLNESLTSSFDTLDKSIRSYSELVKTLELNNENLIQLINSINIVTNDIKKYEQKFEASVTTIKNNEVELLEILNSLDRIKDGVNVLMQSFDNILKNLVEVSAAIKDYDLKQLLEKINETDKAKIELIHKKFDETIEKLNRNGTATDPKLTLPETNGSLERAIRDLINELSKVNKNISNILIQYQELIKKFNSKLKLKELIKKIFKRL